MTAGRQATLAVGSNQHRPAAGEGVQICTPSPEQSPLVSLGEAAADNDVSRRYAAQGAKVHRVGIPELGEAVDNERLSVHVACKVAALPPADQLAVATAPDPRAAARKLLALAKGTTGEDADADDTPDADAPAVEPDPAEHLGGADPDVDPDVDPDPDGDDADHEPGEDREAHTPAAVVEPARPPGDAPAGERRRPATLPFTQSEPHDLPPLPPAPPIPKAHLKGLKGGARPGRFKPDYDRFGDRLRELEDFLSGLLALLPGESGHFLSRLTWNGGERLFELRRARGGGEVWVCPLLEVIRAALMACRVEEECAACRGKVGGCRECGFAGYVPRNRSLLKPKDGQSAFEMGDVWDARRDDPEPATEEGG